MRNVGKGDGKGDNSKLRKQLGPLDVKKLGISSTRGDRRVMSLATPGEQISQCCGSGSVRREPMPRSESLVRNFCSF